MSVKRPILKVVAALLYVACMGACSDEEVVRPQTSRNPYVPPVPAGSWSLPTSPTGAAIDKFGSLIASVGYASPRSVSEFDLEGTFLAPWHIEIGDETLSVVHVVFAEDKYYLTGSIPSQYSLIVVCDWNRAVLRYWQELEYDGASAPFASLDVDELGNVYRLWFDDETLVKYRYDGTVQDQWLTHGPNPTGNNWPGGIAVGSNGRVYVSDTLHNRILIFNRQGALLDTFGHEGEGQGEFQWPSGLAMDDDGYLYVVDRSNERVQQFDGDGSYMLEFSSAANGPYDDTPYGLALGAASILVFHGDGTVNLFAW